MSVADARVCLSDAELTMAEGEREVVERAKREPKAFARLYREHYAVVARHVYRRTGDAHVTEDLVSDVFLTALRALPRYRYRGVPVRFWLLRIATNVVNRWARQRRRGRVAPVSADIQPELTPAGAGRATEVDPERARGALLRLSPKHQAVLSLHYLEGLSVEETAAVLGCRVGTIKSRLSRARDVLRRKLTDRR